MKPIQRVAFIGNHLPRRCGIATFTHDLRRAVSMARPDLETGVVAMTNLGHAYDYPSDVYFQIHDETIAEYVHAAEFLNNAGFDIVCLQHEYGIFGGEAGKNIIISCHTSKCRLSRHFTQCWRNRRQPNATSCDESSMRRRN